MTTDDQRAVLDSLPELYLLRDLAELPGVMLATVARLIDNVFCTYNQINLRTGTLTAAYHPPQWQPRMEAIMPLMEPHIDSHPVYRNVFDNGDGSPHFVSDFLAEREWKQTPFSKALATIGVQESLIFCLQTSRQELIFIALNRARRTFTERDREVAALLRPHFIAAYENAVSFTETQVLALLSAHALERSPHGVALLDEKNEILHMNPVGGELLNTYFARPFSWKTALPPEVIAWLAQQRQFASAPPEPLQIQHGARTLTIRTSSPSPGRRILLMQESAETNRAEHLERFGLSRREAEVLYWAAEGKSNSDIGRILDISYRTVAKHLQVIYEKLAVEGRVAAILRVRGL